LRNNKNIVKPGYDGVYGEILMEGIKGDSKKEEKEKSKGKEIQKGLNEFL